MSGNSFGKTQLLSAHRSLWDSFLSGLLGACWNKARQVFGTVVDLLQKETALEYEDTLD